MECNKRFDENKLFFFYICFTVSCEPCAMTTNVDHGSLQLSTLTSKLFYILVLLSTRPYKLKWWPVPPPHNKNMSWICCNSHRESIFVDVGGYTCVSGKLSFYFGGVWMRGCVCMTGGCFGPMWPVCELICLILMRDWHLNGVRMHRLVIIVGVV